MHYLAVGTLLLACLSAPIISSTAIAQVPAEQVSEVSASTLWSQRSDPKKAYLAIEAFEKQLLADPGNTETMVMLSRAIYFHVHLQQNGGSESERLALLKRGTEITRKAAELEPTNAAAHFWAATNLGVYGKLDGIMKSVSSYDEIKARLATVQKLDPDYFYGAVHRYNGRLIYSVPGMLRSMYGYDLESAEAFFKKALEIESTYVQTWVYLGELYLMMDRPQDAKTTFEHALAVKQAASPEFAAENELFKAQAKVLLQKHFPSN